MNKSILCIILFFVTTPSYAAMAKMAPVMNTPLSELIVYLEKNKPTTQEKPSVLEWALFARDVVGVQYVVSTPNLNLSLITSAQIIASIRSHVGSTEWKPISEEKAKKSLQDWRPTLESQLRSSPFVWAWVQFQLGDSSNSKKTLSPLFDAELARVMKMKQAIYGLGGSPMGELNKLNNALKVMSTDKEKVDLDKKMQKAKVHVSHLPESHVVT